MLLESNKVRHLGRNCKDNGTPMARTTPSDFTYIDGKLTLMKKVNWEDDRRCALGQWGALQFSRVTPTPASLSTDPDFGN